MKMNIYIINQILILPGIAFFFFFFSYELSNCSNFYFDAPGIAFNPNDSSNFSKVRSTCNFSCYISVFFWSFESTIPMNVC